MGFELTEPHYFTYAFEWNGETGEEAVFSAFAYADFDCDTVMSTFQRVGFGAPGSSGGDCELLGSAAFYVEQEAE